MDFGRIYYVLRERTQLIAICVLVCILLAGAYLLRAENVFASRAVILVEQQEKRVVNIQNVTQEDLKAVDVMKTVEQCLLTESLMLRVIKANNLANDRRFLPARQKAYTDEELIRALSHVLSVKLRRGTRLMDICVESKSPELARQLAQAFVDEYVREGFDQRLAASRIANEFLLKEESRLKAKLEESDRKLQEYREKNNAVSLIDKQNIIVETLKELNQKMTEASGQRLRAESDLAQFTKLSNRNPRDLLVIPSIADSRGVQEAKSHVAFQETAIAALKQRYRTEHPKYIEAQSQLAQLNADLDKTILKAGDSIAAAHEAAIMNEGKLSEALRAQEKLSFELNKMAIPYNVLVRDVESDREMYQSILTRLKETDITKALEDNPVRIIESARVPDRPIRPKKSVILMLGIALGLASGVVICFILDAVDSSIKTVDEAEHLLNLPVLSAVPKLIKYGTGSRPELPMLEEPYSGTAEAFRSLRSTLALQETTDARITLFTSACPSEGKTFCSINYAISLAQQGHRTLILDADLRKPSIAKIVHADTEKPGVGDFLSGNASLAECLQESGFHGLQIIHAGGLVRNPNELLARENVSRILNACELAMFDRIVIDSAPLLAVGDTLALIGLSGLVCLVIRASVTPARAILRASRILTEAGADQVGTVLNCIQSEGRRGDFYYSYSSGGYGRAGVYGAPDEVTK